MGRLLCSVGLDKYFSSMEAQINYSFCVFIFYTWGRIFGGRSQERLVESFKSNNSRKRHPWRAFPKGKENPKSIICHYLCVENEPDHVLQFYIKVQLSNAQT